MVDWSLARQVARLAAGSGDEGPPQADVAELCLEMEQHVARYTGLSPGTAVPAAELVGRGEWASVNLDSLAQLLDPVAARPLRSPLRRASSSGTSPSGLSGSTRYPCSVGTPRRACCSWPPTCARRCAS